MNRQIFLAFVIDKQIPQYLGIPLDILVKLNKIRKPEIIGTKDEMQVLL